MSLQVWLPLNGSLENLGLDSFNFTQSIVSGYEDGKIGKALQMKNSNADFMVPSLINAKEFSVAFWYKAIADDTITTNWNKVLRFQTKNADGTSGSDFRFESSYAGNYATANYALSVHNNTTQSLGSIGHEIVNSKGAWHHICFTHTSTDNYTYLDGVQIRYGAGAAGTLTGRIIIAGASPYPNGLMNDLRIYDHCLSTKEVKDLSKGLVAHYPLNDFIGNPNLIQNGYGNSIGTTWIAEGCTLTVEDDCFKIASTSANKRIYDNVSSVWNSGEVYTVSFLARSDTDGAVINASRSIANFSPNFTLSTEWKQYSGIITSTETSAAGTLSIRLVTASTVYIKLVKLEKGSVATPWIPNTQDDLYSAMGLDENIIYDCSGYRHNGENTGCTVNTDSARYKVSTAFDGTSYITLHNDSFPVILSNDFTLSMWIYSDDDGDRSLWLGNYVISNGGNFFGFEKTASNGVRFWWNNGSPDKNFATYITKSEGWVLLTLVKEGNVAKIYKNGVLSTTNTSDLYVSANLPSTATTFRLGADGRITGNTLFKGSMSDARIYATALSAEDIKALYETSVSIDDKGSFHAYEISEV